MLGRWLLFPVILIGTLLTSTAILWLNLPTDFTLSEVADRVFVERNFTELQSELARKQQEVAWAFMGQGVLVILVLSLLVGITCATSFTGDNEKHLRALLQTPTKIRPLLRGKLKRRVRANFLPLLAYAIPAFILAWLAGTVAFAGTVIWWVAAWPIMSFIGAVGVWCSVRTRHSIPSLFATFSFGYFGSLFIFLFIVPVIVVVAFVFRELLRVIGQVGSDSTLIFTQDRLFYTAFFLASGVVATFVYFGLSRHFMTRAERRILALAQGRR